MHTILVVAHLFAVACIFAAVGVELGLLRALSHASTKQEAVVALAGSHASRVIGPVGLLGALASGIALAVPMGEAATSWVAPAVVLLVVVIVVGAAVTGRKMFRVEAALKEANVDLKIVRDPVLRISFGVRALLLVAILVLMVVKP